MREVGRIDEDQTFARAATRGVHVNSDQRLARVAGVLFLITFITSIPALYLFRPVQGIATIPEFLWELSLGIYLTVKGFRPSPILAEDASPVLQTS